MGSKLKQSIKGQGGPKLYTVYIPKYMGEPIYYNITKVISKYMSSTSYDCKIISAPGYMNLNEYTTDEFYENMKDIFFLNSNKSRKIEVGIFNGMNGTNTINGGMISCREQHEKSIVSHGMTLIHLKCNKKRDHRKMLFFMKKAEIKLEDKEDKLEDKEDKLEDKIKYKSEEKIENKEFSGEINIHTYEDFLKSINVEAIMIGSSNQNLTTYFGGLKSSTAGKGEADIFMFTDEEVKDAIIKDKELVNKVVISESISIPDEESGEDYLKSILKDYLKNSLL